MDDESTELARTVEIDADGTLRDRGQKILALVQGVPCETQAQREKAAKILIEIKKEITAVEKQRDEIARPAFEIYKKRRAEAKPLLDPLERAEVVLKERIARGAEEDEKRTAKALAEAKTQDEVVAVVAAAPDKIEGVSFRKIPKYRVVDFDLVPREYLTVNHSKIQLALTERRDQPIPGIEFYDDTTVSASRK